MQTLPLHLAKVVDGVHAVNLYAEYLFDSGLDLSLGSPLVNDKGVGLVRHVVVALLGEYGPDDDVVCELHYTYTSSILATASLVRIRVLYFSIS